MTRYRTFRPRGASPCACAACDVTIGGPGHRRVRADLFGQLLCDAHGHKARRYAEKQLLNLYPNLLVLFNARKDLTFLRPYLHHTILAQILRFGVKEGTTRWPRLLPYHVPGNFRPPRRTIKRPRPAQCGCGDTSLSDDGSRCGTRPWGNETVCRACHVRLMRQHRRATSQFNALVKFVRTESGAWILPLLDPKLTARVTKHLTRFRPRTVRNPDRWI